MKQYTQSNTDPGNCWQTAIACILEVEPDTLPPQVEVETWPDGAVGWDSYTNVLNGYLRKHHGLLYFEIYPYQFGGVRPIREYHTINGPTVRTATNGRDHVVVARNGEAVWDVHPSRAGLISTRSWGVLGTIDPDWEREWQERKARQDDDPDYHLIFGCICPACGLDKARRQVEVFKLTKELTEPKT